MQLVYIAAPLCNLPRFGASFLGGKAKKLCQQLLDDKRLIIHKKGGVEFLTNVRDGLFPLGPVYAYRAAKLSA